MMKVTLSILVLLLGNVGVAAFSTSPAPSRSAVQLYAESSSPETATSVESSTDESTTDASEETSARPSTIYIPLSFEEMVKQVSSAMEDAMKAGKKRQTLRILLPRSSDNEDLGQFFETDVVDPDPSAYVDTILVPPDESWQGGIMQLYRAASLSCQEILRYVQKGNLPKDVAIKVKKTEDAVVDVSNLFAFPIFISRFFPFCTNQMNDNLL